MSSGALTANLPPAVSDLLPSRRTRLVRVIALAFAGTVLVGAVYVWSRPVISVVTYQYRGRDAHTAALPFAVQTEADLMDIRFTMVLEPIHSGTFRVKPDDCIEQLAINSQIVDRRLASFCDYADGRSLDLSPYLRTGRNDFHVTVRDQGGLGGLRLDVAELDPLLLLLWASFVACATRLCFAVVALASNDTMDVGVLAVAAGGSILRFLYVLATPFQVRAYDTDGHIEYIRYVATNLRIPSATAGWEFFQPPLYYFVTGLYVRWATALGQSLQSILSTIQVFSLILTIASFLVGLWIGTLLFESRRERAQLLLYGIIIGSLPALVYPASRISNDPLYQWLSFLSFGLLVSWWERGDTRTWYALLVTVSLAISTKASGVVFLPGIFACLFLRDRGSWRSQMRHAALALAVVWLVAGSVPIARIMRDPGAHRLLNLGTEGLNPALGVDTKARNLLTFNPIAMIDKPENNTWLDQQRRQYLWEFFFRSALFSEFSFAKTLQGLERLMVALGLLALPLAAVGLAYEGRRRLHRSLPLLVVTGSLFAAVVWYRLTFHNAPGQDIRFVTLVAVLLSWAAVRGAFVLPPLWRRLGVAVLATQAGLCALFLVLLMFFS